MSHNVLDFMLWIHNKLPWRHIHIYYLFSFIYFNVIMLGVRVTVHRANANIQHWHFHGYLFIYLLDKLFPSSSVIVHHLADTLWLILRMEFIDYDGMWEEVPWSPSYMGWCCNEWCIQNGELPVYNFIACSFQALVIKASCMNRIH